ncbi:hypothetical protein GmHk_15G044779 [Glycine max]|nr:hypothetical protein GmHk_15G044779 [Glycine max]
MYNYHEKRRAPDLESVLADFVTYQACSKEGLSNLDYLLMQFKDTIDSMQQAFKRTKTQIGKLVDDMTKVMVRREEKYAEIVAHQESILQVTTIHHQLINKEEKDEVSSTPEYPCMATAGYVVGKDKGRLELSLEDQKISFDLFEAMKHSDMGDACYEEEKVEQEIALSASTMVAWPEAQLPLVRPNEAAPPEPAPAWVEPIPAEPRSPVVNPPPSPELEVVPPSPPLIIISDASSDETAAPPDSPIGEIVDPPVSPVGGIADLSDSSSGEAVALTDSLVYTLIRRVCEVLIFTL